MSEDEVKALLSKLIDEIDEEQEQAELKGSMQYDGYHSGMADGLGRASSLVEELLEKLQGGGDG